MHGYKTTPIITPRYPAAPGALAAAYHTPSTDASGSFPAHIALPCLLPPPGAGAAEQYAVALQLDPRDAVASNNRAVCAMYGGNLAGGIATLEVAFATAPDCMLQVRPFFGGGGWGRGGRMEAEQRNQSGAGPQIAWSCLRSFVTQLCSCVCCGRGSERGLQDQEGAGRGREIPHAHAPALRAL